MLFSCLTSDVFNRCRLCWSLVELTVSASSLPGICQWWIVEFSELLHHWPVSSLRIIGHFCEIDRHAMRILIISAPTKIRSVRDMYAQFSSIIQIHQRRSVIARFLLSGSVFLFLGKFDQWKWLCHMRLKSKGFNLSFQSFFTKMFC